MIGQPLYRTNLLASERTTLETLIRKQTTPQHLAKRARIILLANGEAATNRAISEQLGVTPAQVTMWTKRWIERAMEPLADRLADGPRSGRPDTITAEPWCQILALACEPPEQYGRPITHWTSRELAAEVIRQGIVERISAGHLRKVLKKKIFSLTAAAIGSTPRPTNARMSASPTFATCTNAFPAPPTRSPSASMRRPESRP